MIGCNVDDNNNVDNDIDGDDDGGDGKNSQKLPFSRRGFGPLAPGHLAEVADGQSTFFK